MSGKTQFEVVMECNIRARARVDHPVWAPCATSTPLRKPSLTLNNAEVLDNSKKFDVMPAKPVRRALAAEKAGGKRPREKRNNDMAKKKSNKSSRILHCLDDDDDDDDSEDEKTGGQAKKHLIIKLSSSQFNKRSLRRKRPIMETNPNFNEDVKDSNTHESLQLVKTSNSEIEKCNGNKNSISLHQTQNVKLSGKDADVKETSKNSSTSNINTYNSFNSNSAHNNKISKSVKSPTKLADIPEKLLNSINDNKTNSDALQKRKNKKIKIPHVKKLKTESDLSVSLANVNALKKSNSIPNKIGCKEKPGKIADIMRKKNVGRLSMSHEIFSDSKEREFRDSLDLTAVDQDESPIGDINDIKLPVKHKNLLKWNYASPGQNIKSEPSKKILSINSELSRPRRIKKSPKEFWLPKSEKNYVPSPENNEAKQKYIKDDDHIVSSTQKVDEPESAAIKVSTSDKDEGSHVPSDEAYVKTISELNFVENSMENGKNKFSVAMGWQFSTFKCCALKIGAKCEASNRGKSSHFGGVVIKGRLSMKIGETAVTMKEGQMFYVPPSTDWRAINIGRIDCILYYWVGKL